MSRGIRRLHRGMTAATHLHRTAIAAIRQGLNHTAAAVAARRRMVVVALRPTVAVARHMKAVATAIRNRPRIPSTVSVLAPSLRI